MKVLPYRSKNEPKETWNAEDFTRRAALVLVFVGVFVFFFKIVFF